MTKELTAETNFALSLVDFDIQKVLVPLLAKERLTHAEQAIVNELTTVMRDVEAEYVLIRNKLIAEEREKGE